MMNIRGITLGGCIASLFAFVSVVSAQQPHFRPELDWKIKWHGQTRAIDVISKGKALKGYHFDNNYNRITEAPWNAVQTLLGAYFVSTVGEYLQTKAFDERIERLSIAQCRAVMSMLSSQQSLYEGHVVYQLDDWRPSDSVWHKVWEQPPLARLILGFDRAREDQIRKFLAMKVIPLRSVDSCEMTKPPQRTFSIDQTYSDGFEISWIPDDSSTTLLHKISRLKSSGLLSKAEIAEIDTILLNFERMLDY